MFQIGDIVRIRDNFSKLRFYDDDPEGKDPGVIDEMLEFAGKEREVREYDRRRSAGHTTWYTLVNGGGWTWDERWLEPVKTCKTITESEISNMFM